jgi:TetR/AcrR family transcriptional repressor of mexJK operon
MSITEITPSETLPLDSPRSEARRRAILDVARDIFLAQGYAATSMSEIATRLGGSKGTLYNYFRSKEELFAAFMIDTCQGPSNEVFDHMPTVSEDLRNDLIELAGNLLRFLFRESTMAVHRLVIAESGRFPELGVIFYENGPRKGDVKLGAYIQQVMDAGLLRPGDPIATGRWFKNLVLADIYNKRLWGVIADPTPALLRAHATEATDIFLAAFATKG